jgi:hypothetical protein
MKHYIVHMYVGYAGMDGYEALSMPDDATEEEIQEEAHYMALDHAESYGYYPPDCDYDEEDEEDTWNSDKISDNIEGYAELYDPEKHDMHRAGGGSFQLDFDWYDSKVL